MRNNGYFQFKVTPEQINAALELVEYSLKHHPVTDIYAGDKTDTYGLTGEERAKAYRLTGTLGEILFADVYGLPRPTRSFGAIDGQDNGKDFKLMLADTIVSVDVKTMRRNYSGLRSYYVLDLPAYQIKKNALTDCYFHITLIAEDRLTLRNCTAAFVGYIYKSEIDTIGEFYAKGSLRAKDSGKPVLFSRDTYEIKLGDLLSPPTPENTERLPEFKRVRIYDVERK